MKPFRLDANGVPILNRTNLEERAEAFLGSFDPQCLREPLPTPIALITQRLHQKGHAEFIFNRDLGTTPDGRKIRGRFHIPSRTVFVDHGLQPGEPRFNFTLAHEIAHFVLHRTISLKALRVRGEPEITDTDRELTVDQIEGANPRTWIEWQANKFAASLLLPRITFPHALRKRQMELGIRRNLGVLYIDRHGANRREVPTMLEHLARFFQVSKTVVRIRLTELNLLMEQPGSGPQSAAQILRKMVRGDA
jgi:hypothetical protein